MLQLYCKNDEHITCMLNSKGSSFDSGVWVIVYIMSLKLSIESAVHIGSIILKQFHKIGWVQYRISVYYEGKNFKSKVRREEI